MSEYAQARLFFLTQPSPGVYIINLDDGQQFTRIEITKDQLGNIIADGAAMAFRARLSTEPTTPA